MDRDEASPGVARLTVFRLMLAVAVAAILLLLATDWARGRHDRLLGVADNHARLGGEYRRNAGKNPTMLVISAWHAELSRRFERASARPWEATPRSSPFPPPGWLPPARRSATGPFEKKSGRPTGD